MQDVFATRSTSEAYAQLNAERKQVRLARKLKHDWPHNVGAREFGDMLLQLHLFYIRVEKYGSLWQRWVVDNCKLSCNAFFGVT